MSDPIETTTDYLGYTFMRIWRLFFPEKETAKQVAEDESFVAPTAKEILARDAIKEVKASLSAKRKNNEHYENVLDSSKNRMESHKKTIEELQELTGEDSPLKSEARWKISIFEEYYKNASRDYDSAKEWLDTYSTKVEALETRLKQLEALLTESKS